MNKVEISADAILDLEEGYDFYEEQEFGAGDYFLSQIKAEINGFKVNGGDHKLVFKDLHRSISKKFPYSVFYTYQADTVLVVAVVDNRRDPDWIREHLSRIN